MEISVKIKKILLVLILVLLILSFCSCLKNKEQSTASNFSVAQNNFEVLNIPLNAEIIFFDNSNILYLLSDQEINNDQQTEKTLFKYNFKEHKKYELTKFNNAITATESIACHGKKIYLPYKTSSNRNVLLEIDMESNSFKAIKQWDADTVFSYIYSIDNVLILFSIDAIDSEVTEYNIKQINLSDYSKKNIVSKRFSNKEAEFIPAIDVDDKYIYALLVKQVNEKQNYHIIKYDLGGNALKSYKLDLKNFIEQVNPSNKNDVEKDIIFNIYKENNYFILTTLNGRISIFQQNKDGIDSIEVPKDLYEDFPSGYNFLNHLGKDNQFAYFVNPNKSKNTMYVFDYTTGEFTSINFSTDKNNINVYYRNETGDILLKKMNLYSINKQQYFYLKEDEFRDLIVK